MIYPKKPPPYPVKDSRTNLPSNRKTVYPAPTINQLLINEQFKVSKQRPSIHKVTSLYDLKIDLLPEQDYSNDPEVILSPKGKSGAKSERLIESISVKNPITVLKKHYQQSKQLNTSRDKGNNRSRSNSKSKQRKKLHSQSEIWNRNQSSKLRVQPFIPAQIPARNKVSKNLKDLQQQYYNTSSTTSPRVRREIQIFLQKDRPVQTKQKREQPKSDSPQMKEDSSSFDLLNQYSQITSLSVQDKKGLKKLFKKVRKLADQLQVARQQRNKLQMELNHLKGIHGECEKHQENIKRLQKENFKLQTQIEMLKKQFQLQKRQRSMERLYTSNRKCPGSKNGDSDNSRSSSFKKERVREVIIEKPIYIEKLVPGPQRIVEKVTEVPKIIEVPKYIEIQKKVYSEPVRQAPQIITQTKYIEIEKPIYVEKPIYMDKPIYIDRPVLVQGGGLKGRQRDFLAQSPPSNNANYRTQVEQKHTSYEPVSIPVPYPYEVAVYIDKPIVDNSHLAEVERLESQNISLKQRNSQLTREIIGLRTEVIKHSNNLQILRRHNESKNKEVEHLLRNTKDYSPVSSTSTAIQRQVIRR